MQVNSAQDYLTNRKRQIIAATYNTVPPPQSKRYNSVYTSALANSATRYQMAVFPFQGAWGGASGGETFTSLCCLTGTNVFGTFRTTTDRGVVRFNVIPPMSYRATSSTG